MSRTDSSSTRHDVAVARYKMHSRVAVAVTAVLVATIGAVTADTAWSMVRYRALSG